MEQFCAKRQLFVFDEKKWTSICKKDYQLPDPPTVTAVDEGIILPLKKRSDVKKRNATFAGGVCKKDGTFVAGLLRSITVENQNLACECAYLIPKEVIRRHETVVFGGILYEAFGHTIQDSLVRLWWFVENQDTPYKIAFLESPVFGEFTHYSVLEAAGISRDKIMIITQPTQFDKIIVPQESNYIFSGYRPKSELILDQIIKNSPVSEYKRVYLSRTKLERQDTFNEIYFEEFYRRRGYHIVYPEQLEFTEQVALLHCADEVVCTKGTLSGNLIFCKPGTKVVILDRSTEVGPQYIIALQRRRLDYSIVDANFNFLPAGHAGQNMYLFGPTKYWVNYLKTHNIPYEEEEVSLEKHIKPLLYDYIIKWAQNYVKITSYKEIHNKSIVDIIDNIYKVFLGQTINRAAFQDRDDVIKLKKENESLRQKLEISQIKVETLEKLFADTFQEMITLVKEEEKKKRVPSNTVGWMNCDPAAEKMIGWKAYIKKFLKLAGD